MVIDHTITNDKIHIQCPSVLQANLTDHYPTMCIIDNLTVIKNNTKNVPSYRDRKSHNSQIFCNKLDKKLGELATNNLPLNHAIFNFVFDKFVAQITEMIDKHTPLQHLCRKQKIGKKTCITKEILTSIHLKNSRFCSHFINGTEKDKSYFRRYSNILTKIKTLF